MIKVNLLAQARREAAPKKGPSISFEGMGNLPSVVTVILIIASIGYCGWMYYSLSARQKQLSEDLAQAEIDLAKVEEDIRIANELEQKRARVQQQIDLIIELKQNQQVPVRLLDEISKNLPDFLWLTALSESGGALTFSGKATTPTAYANFYNNLNGSLYFTDVGRISYREEGPQGGVSFSLAARFIPRPGAGPAGGAEGGQ
jgi:type IV pilus assembly protein PilN